MTRNDAVDKQTAASGLPGPAVDAGKHDIVTSSNQSDMRAVNDPSLLEAVPTTASTPLQTSRQVQGSLSCERWDWR